MAADIIYVGTRGKVAAIDKATGTTLWRVRLKSGLTTGGFVTLLVERNRVYAQTGGALFCLDARSGDVLWSNNLESMGYDIASLATEDRTSSPASAAAEQQARAAASTAAATA